MKATMLLLALVVAMTAPACTTYYGVAVSPNEVEAPILITSCTNFLIFGTCGVYQCARVRQELKCKELEVEEE
jgi:hypothetical protein